MPRFGAMSGTRTVTRIEVLPLTASDRGQWEALARAYKAFYLTNLPDSAYEDTGSAFCDETACAALAPAATGASSALLISCSTPASGRRVPVISRTCSWNPMRAAAVSHGC